LDWLQRADRGGKKESRQRNPRVETGIRVPPQVDGKSQERRSSHAFGKANNEKKALIAARIAQIRVLRPEKYS
jgi:hypothetical protein